MATKLHFPLKDYGRIFLTEFGGTVFGGFFFQCFFS